MNSYRGSCSEYEVEYEFLVGEITKRKLDFPKTVQLRVDRWLRKFSEVSGNLEWEKNRNLYCILLLDYILNNKFEEPFNKNPTDQPLALISKSNVKAQLSTKFKDFIQLNKESLDKMNEKRQNKSNTIESPPSRSAYSTFTKNEKGVNRGEQEINRLKQIVNNVQEEILEKNRILAMQEKRISDLKQEIFNNEQVIKTVSVTLKNKFQKK